MEDAPQTLPLRGSDNQRLHLLTELSVLGTIAKVAEAVNLTRPAVSQQLAILEQETGTVLFERSGRGVRLTIAGDRAYYDPEETGGPAATPTETATSTTAGNTP